MLTKRIIPCLDVKDGRVVKGVGFVGLRDAGNPVEAAKAYDGQGADELVFLDITASHEKRKTILQVAERTAEEVFMPVTIGGGIKTIDDIREMLRAGEEKREALTRWSGPKRPWNSAPEKYSLRAWIKTAQRTATT